MSEGTRYILHIALSCLAAMFITAVRCSAQEQRTAVLSWEDFATLTFSDSDDEGGYDADLYESLYEIHCQPFNINQLTHDDLARLPFLSESQILAILAYADKNRPVISTGELRLIESIDHDTADMLALFLYAGQPSDRQMTFANRLARMKHELTLRTDIPFYRQAGFLDYDDSTLLRSPNKAYVGGRSHDILRYKVSSGQDFSAGITMEKDAGERGIDYVTGYAMLRKVKIAQRLSLTNTTVGNFRPSFGLGLIVNCGMRFGKTMAVGSMSTLDRGISGHTSTYEVGYLTGGATTFSYSTSDNSHLSLTPYFSFRRADGTWASDSSGLTSLYTSGYHRTPGERTKHHNINVTDFGANLQYILGDHLHFSLTAAHTSFSVPLSPKYDTPSSLYRKYNARGSAFNAFSAAYQYSSERLTFTGETAITQGEHTGWATLNTLLWNANSNNTLSVIQRYYQARFAPINGRTFSENSVPQNELGVYVGWRHTFSRKLSTTAYIDLFRFPWMRYQTSSASYGYEANMQVQYQPTRTAGFSLRYHLKSRQKDGKAPDDTPTLFMHSRHTIRLIGTFSPLYSLTLKTTASADAVTFATSTTSYGYAITQALSWRPVRNYSPTTDLAITYFNTDDYESRIYNVEPSLLYTFGMTALMYHGMRLTTRLNLPLLRYKHHGIQSRLDLSLCFAMSKYFNRKTIGTGTALINRSDREDLQIQIRWVH